MCLKHYMARSCFSRIVLTTFLLQFEMPLLPKDRLSRQDLKEALKARLVGYLDLAGVNLPFSGAVEGPGDAKNPLAIVDTLDLALHSRYVAIRNGAKKIVNLALLKAQGASGEMLLFPNFPLEIRTKIYKLSLLGRLMRMIEDVQPDGTHYLIVAGSERPAIVKASKEAMEILLATKVYQPLFQLATGRNRYYYNPVLDHVRLHTMAPAADKIPSLSLSASLMNPLDLQAIRVLSVDINHMAHVFAWVYANIADMSGLKSVHFSGTIEDPVVTNESVVRMFLKDVNGNKKFSFFCETENGVKLSGDAALHYAMLCSGNMASGSYFTRLWTEQERARNHVPNYPSVVAFYLWFVHPQ